MLDEAPQSGDTAAAATPPGVSPPGVSPSASPDADLRYRFALAFPRTMRLPAGPMWLIKGLMPRHGMLVLYGVSGFGKSFIALDAALHVAAGRPWAGRKVTQAGVVYVASEAGRGMVRRVLAAIEHHGFPQSLPFALVTVAPDLGHREGDARALVDDIRAQLPPNFSPGLIILDMLARSMVGGDESGSAGMGVFIENAEFVGRKLGALVMPVHHAGKDVERGMRGSSALLGAADAVWQVAPDGSNRIRVEKMKEDVGKQDVAFHLRRFTLGYDSDQDEITTCVVEMGEVEPAVAPATGSTKTEPEAQSRPLPAGAASFLEMLTLAIEEHGKARSRAKWIPKTAKVVKQADLKTFAEIVVNGATAKGRQSSINRHVGELVSRGLVHRHNGYLWIAEPQVNHRDENTAGVDGSEIDGNTST